MNRTQNFDAEAILIPQKRNFIEKNLTILKDTMQLSRCLAAKNL